MIVLVGTQSVVDRVENCRERRRFNVPLGGCPRLGDEVAGVVAIRAAADFFETCPAGSRGTAHREALRVDEELGVLPD